MLWYSGNAHNVSYFRANGNNKSRLRCHGGFSRRKNIILRSNEKITGITTYQSHRPRSLPNGMPKNQETGAEWLTELNAEDHDTRGLPDDYQKFTEIIKAIKTGILAKQKRRIKSTTTTATEKRTAAIDS
jgi:hypothetical protein